MRLGNPLTPLSHLPTTISTPIPSQPHADPSKMNTTPAHQSTGTHEASQRDTYHGKDGFTLLDGRERTAQRIKRTAKSTMRAAGAAVSKLWMAAGKALSEEAKSLEDDVPASTYRLNTLHDQHHVHHKKEEKQGGESSWRRLFPRFRYATKGAQEEPTVSAEEDAFARFFEQACHERGGAECSQDAKTAYALMQESRSQHVHLLEANLGRSSR